MTPPPPPRRPLTFHVVAFAVVALLSAGLYLLFRGVASRLPARGYTTLGLALGVGAAAAFVLATLYSYRKRVGQEHVAGRLQTWLRVHAWVSIAGFFAVLLHSGFHLDGGTGTWAFALLALTIASGVGGWAIYVEVPGTVASTVKNLAVRGTEEEIDDLRARMEDAAAGRSAPFKARVARLLDPAAPPAAGGLEPGEGVAYEGVESLARAREEAQARRVRQGRLHRYLRGWLWVHVPAACLFLLALVAHGYDATEARWLVSKPGPRDFASPESCAKCHKAQYDEWIGSSHAVAMSSPVMEFQNRLVVLKDRRDHPDGRLVVGDLCAKCHAPTGYLPQATDHEDVLAAIASRAPASRYGISCVACHQIASVTPDGPEGHRFGVHFVNMENLAWTQGRTMFGPIGQPGAAALPSIGNSDHRGEGSAAFDGGFARSHLCASCHTVGIQKPPAGSRREATEPFLLQNTYSEWAEAELALGSAGSVPTCMHCHNRDVSDVAEQNRRPLAAGETAAERARAIQARLLAPGRLPAERAAASPRDAFDLPLPDRREFLHTFTGVDVHVGPDTPYAAGHAQHEENPGIRAAALSRTASLLKMAAAIRIEGWPAGGNLEVTVANVGAGHHLPAGFAFAREMWLEVATAARGSEDWRVIVGGRDGPLLAGGERLDKADPRLRNFQAVLWNADAPPDDPARGETVLQNEATEVLTGNAANDHGFPDREKFLAPGEARRVRPIAAHAWPVPWDDGGVGRIRVRLRFRSLPPEFLERLADLLRVEHDAAAADLARAMIDRLEIFDMAEAVVEAP